MDFLIGSPLSSPVGQRIQRATSAALQAEDWGLNMEICDIINETDEGPKDAMKAIKKKIVGNKNFREVMLALTVLETCVKNCGHRFHIQVCSQEFVEGVLVGTILPKNNPPMVLQDRILSLIQAWADAFRNTPSLAGVVSVYDDLRKRGLEFPMTDLDALSPIHTPSRSIPEDRTSAPSVPVSAVCRTRAPIPTPTPTPQANGSAVPLSREQKQKLRAELDLVKGNLTVMTEMLNQLKPGESSPSDLELLQQLNSVCKSMQQRVVELIPRLCEEELIGELLVVNDDLNNAFIRYERFERLSVTQQATTEQTGNLIDLSPVMPPANQASLPPEVHPVADPPFKPMNNAEEEDEFDMFAQTRGSSLAEQRKSVRYEDPGAIESLAGALDTRLQVTGGMPTPQNAAMDDIEKWLSAETHDATNDEGVTSEAFDRFLAERAKVVDHLPSVQNPPSAATNPQLPKSSGKQESAQDEFFSL
ncbi:target of Myb protein 1-like isoform X2 [Electrophorus electricus]|uniref:Target of myb1 membrane trafficking protein n=1 Tax=Electrophorus electricus TaxID=8005 RepID=A0A4W4ECV9_ELEEL|nr:target of Myb protein 1-like isoform X2 [Electrophorus electricus]